MRGSAAGDDDEVVAVHAPEHEPRLLLEEVAVDLIGAQERDAPLPFLTLDLHRLELLAALVGLDLELPLRLHAAMAVVRMMDEICDDRPGGAVERERQKEPAQAALHDHALRLAGDG